MKASLLAFVAACTQVGSTDAPRPPARDVATTQAEASALCVGRQRLPTANDVRELLGECVETEFGWQCTPCATGGCEERYGGDDALTHNHVWTSSGCILPGDELGFYFADLYLGQIVCGHASEPEALPLCVR